MLGNAALPGLSETAHDRCAGTPLQVAHARNQGSFGSRLPKLAKKICEDNYPSVSVP